MYWSERIDPACTECHKTHHAPAREVIARWNTRSAKMDKPGQIVCTDCHGNHRMELRTVRWNKRTGKLLVPGSQGTCGR